MAEAKNWHKTEQLNEDTWRIIEGEVISCYLLLGEERALLIDTGNGMGDIGAQVRAITDLPVTVALTHLHCDHACGRKWFNSPAHVHEADMTLTNRLFSCSIAGRMLAAKWTTPKDFRKKPYNAGYTAMSDGAVFELGGRTVKVEHLPGHTPGSVAYLDEKHKMMFAGDNILAYEMWLFLPGALSLEEWLTTGRRILELSGEYTPYSGHGDGLMTAQQVEQLIEMVQEIVSTKHNSLLHGKKLYSVENVKSVIAYDPAKIHARKKIRP